MRISPSLLLTRAGVLWTAALCLFAATSDAQGSSSYDKKAQPEEARIEDRVGAHVPLDVVLTNQDGQQVRLEDYLGQGKPVLLTLG